jgi:hypothetical protein
VSVVANPGMAANFEPTAAATLLWSTWSSDNSAKDSAEKERKKLSYIIYIVFLFLCVCLYLLLISELPRL